MSRFGSDHAAIRIDLEAVVEDVKRKIVHVFRFEEVWAEDPKCNEAVRNLWVSSGANTVNKLKAMQNLDNTFKEYMVGNLCKDIKRLYSLLEEDRN